MAINTCKPENRTYYSYWPLKGVPRHIGLNLNEHQQITVPDHSLKNVAYNAYPHAPGTIQFSLSDIEMLLTAASREQKRASGLERVEFNINPKVEGELIEWMQNPPYRENHKENGKESRQVQSENII